MFQGKIIHREHSPGVTKYLPWVPARLYTACDALSRYFINFDAIASGLTSEAPPETVGSCVGSKRIFSMNQKFDSFVKIFRTQAIW